MIVQKDAAPALHQDALYQNPTKRIQALAFRSTFRHLFATQH